MMAGGYALVPGDYPADGPVLWLGRRVFADAGWVEVADGAPVVIAYGEACREHFGLAGVFLAPRLDRPEIIETINTTPRPRLVVGVAGAPWWSASGAARLHGTEVLQLPGVNDRFEVPGDVIGSIVMLSRLAERMKALVRRL